MKKVKISRLELLKNAFGKGKITGVKVYSKLNDFNLSLSFTGKIFHETLFQVISNLSIFFTP